jgi:hypothetical protein
LCPAIANDSSHASCARRSKVERCLGFCSLGAPDAKGNSRAPHSDSQLRMQAQEARDAEQLGEAYAIQVVLGERSGPEPDTRVLVLLVANRGLGGPAPPPLAAGASMQGVRCLHASAHELPADSGRSGVRSSSERYRRRSHLRRQSGQRCSDGDG